MTRHLCVCSVVEVCTRAERVFHSTDAGCEGTAYLSRLPYETLGFSRLGPEEVLLRPERSREGWALELQQALKAGQVRPNPGAFDGELTEAGIDFDA